MRATLGILLLLSSLSACASPATEEHSMDPAIRIQYAGVPVSDQDQALAFYTEKLGFEIVHDIPLGEFRWLTVRSPAGVNGVEFLLEPNALPETQTYQKALYDKGIPWTTLPVEDMAAVHAMLVERGVTFVREPMDVGGGMWIAVIDDTCGNLIQLNQQGS